MMFSYQRCHAGLTQQSSSYTSRQIRGSSLSQASQSRQQDTQESLELTQSSDYFVQSVEQQSPTNGIEERSQTRSLSESLTSQLIKSFGEDAQFNDSQREVIKALTEDRKSLLVVQPAGWGKTFVYLTAAKALRKLTGKVTLVISPLLALIRNQIALAKQYDVSLQHIGESLISSKDERSKTLSMIRTGKLDALITTPEQLSKEIFDIIADDVDMLVVDEAHCICQWGYNFRPSYRYLERFADLLKQLEKHPGTPILIVSSTITKLQENQLCSMFKIKEPEVRGLLPLRNVHLNVVHMVNEQNALKWLAEIIPKLPTSGIIYCFSVAKTEKVAFWLRSKGIKARAYYSNVIPDAFDLSENERSEFNDDSERYQQHLVQQLRNNVIDVLVSTSALSMGVDIPNVGYVIAFELPSSLQILYQEFGRAGRSTSEKAYGIVMYVNKQLPNIQCDAFFERKDVSEVCTVIAQSSDAMSISQLERVCNLSAETIRRILTYLSTMKQPLVAYRSKECAWKNIDMNAQKTDEVLSHISKTREALNKENEVNMKKVKEFLENSERCMMKLLCENLGGAKLPEDYCCNKCAVCTKSVVQDTQESPAVSEFTKSTDYVTQSAEQHFLTSQISPDDRNLFLQSDARPLEIQKAEVPEGAFLKHNFSSAFREAPRIDICGISVSSYSNDGLAAEFKMHKSKNTSRCSGHRRFRPPVMSDKLINDVVELFRWSNVSSSIPSSIPLNSMWVTFVPSADVPTSTMEKFAQRFASQLGLQFKNVVEINKEKEMTNKWNKKNPYFRCRNLDDGYIIKEEDVLNGPVVVIDYLMRSGWTMLVVAELLRQAGSGPAIPLALMTTARNNNYM